MARFAQRSVFYNGQPGKVSTNPALGAVTPMHTGDGEVPPHIPIPFTGKPPYDNSGQSIDTGFIPGSYQNPDYAPRLGIASEFLHPVLTAMQAPFTALAGGTGGMVLAVDSAPPNPNPPAPDEQNGNKRLDRICTDGSSCSMPGRASKCAAHGYAPANCGTAPVGPTTPGTTQPGITPGTTSTGQLCDLIPALCQLPSWWGGGSCPLINGVPQCTPGTTLPSQVPCPDGTMVTPAPGACVSHGGNSNDGTASGNPTTPTTPTSPTTTPTSDLGTLLDFLSKAFPQSTPNNGTLGPTDSGQGTIVIPPQDTGGSTTTQSPIVMVAAILTILAAIIGFGIWLKKHHKI